MKVAISPVDGTAERRLLVAIVALAIDDCSRGYKAEAQSAYRFIARKWWLMRLCCDVLDVHPERVHAAAKHLLANNERAGRYGPKKVSAKDPA